MNLGVSGHSDYRPDIDGLRAVAVLSVLAVHAFPGAVPGGFIGVDIFFVVSGFLISRIILGDLATGRFTFADFYARRVRRIFPALALVLFACLVFGWLSLLPFDYRELGAHVSAGAGFISNILLWGEAGNYFDSDAQRKPLLHLWSLGVEEQYYLLWPLALFLLRRHANLVLVMIIGVAIVSFLLNVVMVTRQPSAAFYLPPTRFWELMCGSYIAYVHLNHTHAFGRQSTRRFPVSAAQTRFLLNAVSLAGACLIAVGIFFLSEHRPFPGWWALVPTAGAVMLIAAGPDAFVNRRVLAQRGLVFVGLISYPLYLWHWPVLVFARILHDGDPPVPTRLAALAASILLAWLTYEIVEKRIRHARPVTAPQAPVLALVASIAALGVYGLLVFSGYSQARSASVPNLAQISLAVHDWRAIDDQTIRGDTQQTVLFFGDSHMQQYFPRIESVARARSSPVRTVVLRARGGCSPVPGIERRGYQCYPFVTESLALARQPEVDTVVIAASWVGFMQRTDYYKAGESGGVPLDLAGIDSQWVLQGFAKVLQSLVMDGKRVVIVLSSPHGSAFSPVQMARRDGLGFRVQPGAPVARSTLVAENSYIDDRLTQIARQVGAELVNPMDALCDSVLCPTIDADGNPLYMDTSHLRASFVREHFKALDPYIFITPLPARMAARTR